jgi:hypothetical protein
MNESAMMPNHKIKYWHTAAGTALARAALDRFKIDKNDERALVLARRAIEHQRHTKDSAPIFDILFTEMRSPRRVVAQSGYTKSLLRNRSLNFSEVPPAPSRCASPHQAIYLLALSFCQIVNNGARFKRDYPASVAPRPTR